MRLLRHLCIALLALPVLAQEPLKTVTTPRGVKFDLLAEGTPGTAPTPGDRVKVHYTGWLANGTKFDSTRDRNQPLEFVLGGGTLIEGWDEGIPLMDVGSKCRLSIPSVLAYGSAGNERAKIPPDADLVYEIELLDVVKGRPVPEFRPADPEKQKATESGLKWEVIREGSGEPPGAKDVVQLRCTVWDMDGRLGLCSAALGFPVTGEVDGVRLTAGGEKFLPEALTFMRLGGSYRLEVPAALCWGTAKVLPRLAAEVPTVWQIDFDRVIRFAPLDPEKTRKTESGLEYEVIEEGGGATPGPQSRVAVHYTGWLAADGKEFDSSHRRGQPTPFALTQVIKGWTEGLQLMKEGAIYRVRVPAALAYGKQGYPRAQIPPDADLVFLIELLRVQ